MMGSALDLSSYPGFPRRALLAAAAVVLVLVSAAVVVNESGPDIRDCAVVAARVMARHGYSVAIMELMGRDALPACRGLSEREFVQAIMATYQIAYGHSLAHGSGRLGVPSPAYRARSAQAQSQRR